MIDVKKVVLILILGIAAAPMHYLYNYNTLKITRESGWTIIDYKGIEVQTTKEIDENVKVEKVKEHLAKVDSECEVLKIVGD